MKMKELIEQLQYFSPELEVNLSGDGGPIDHFSGWAVEAFFAGMTLEITHPISPEAWLRQQEYDRREKQMRDLEKGELPSWMTKPTPHHPFNCTDCGTTFTRKTSSTRCEQCLEIYFAKLR